MYADTSNSGLGVGIAFGFVEPPDYVTNAGTPYNPYLIALGNDYAGTSVATPATLPAGTVVLDHDVMVIVPHTGNFASVSPTLLGLMEGVVTAQGAAEE